MDDVKYARAEDGTHIAYRVYDDYPPGSGKPDLVMSTGGLIPMEVYEDNAGLARMLEGLRAIGRLVVFDRRGLGLSDPIVSWDRPILDQWADDLALVVQTSGVESPTIVSWDNLGVATRFSADYPSLHARLVLHEPITLPPDEWEAWRDARTSLVRDNLTSDGDALLGQIAPSCANDPDFRAWYTRAGRVGASPATAERIWASIFTTALHEQPLDRIMVPTLVITRLGNAYLPRSAPRHAAAQIPDAMLVELDGVDHFPFCGDVDSIVAEVAAFVTGERRLPPPKRMLAALMFTDLVSSTEQAAALGDERWKAVLDRHDKAARAAVGRCGGEVVKTTGDGVLALLPSGGGAIRSAQRIRKDLDAEGLAVRIGIHVGDVDERGDDISGLAVHIAARVMSAADTGEIVVTASARASDTEFIDHFESVGTRALKGVPGEWELFRLTS